jgi:DNA-binding NtrC family response regulator
LRERAEDVSVLAHFFLRRYARAVGRSVEEIEPESLARLLAYPWPGNVRELENVIQRALILSPGPVLVVPAGLVDRQLGAAPSREQAPRETADGALLESGGIEPFEQRVRQHVLDALERCGWRIEGERGAARDLGLHPNTLRSKMKRLGIRRPGPSS